MNEHNFLEDSLVILTKQTLDVFLMQSNPADLIALYTFYYYTAKWQGTNQIKCTTGYVATGLHWSENRVRKTKKQLLDFGLIEDAHTIDENNRIVGHYIKMNYIFKKENVENINFHPNDFPQGGKNHSVETSTGWKEPQCGNIHSMEKLMTNALSSDIGNALSSDIGNALSSDIGNALSSDIGNAYVCPEPKKASEPTYTEPPIITLTLNTKEEYPIYQKDIDEWKELYPAVDVMQELRKMKGWCNANPSKRKTKSGIGRFINGWLSREQDNGGIFRNQQKNTYQSREEQITSRVSVVDSWGFPEGNESDPFTAN